MKNFKSDASMDHGSNIITQVRQLFEGKDYLFVGFQNFLPVVVKKIFYRL